MGDNYVNIQHIGYDYSSCALPFPWLPSIYKPSSISVHFVLPKIWPGQASITKNKWLWGDNSVNIQGMTMVLIHSTSSHCHLSINQVSFQSLCTFQDMTRTGNTYKKWLWGDNTINIQGRTMVLVHSTASHCKHFSWTSMWLLKMNKPWYFSGNPKHPFYKISTYQCFTSKQTLIVASPLSFKNSNP